MENGFETRDFMVFISDLRFWRRNGKFGLFLISSSQTFNVNEELNGGFYS